ncbi:hypothetical protein [Paludibacter sp.]|uniref:hypothetical protein n=1 Tax=Paludibacter sp. TaxID=1898105 RepID=UPI0025E1CC55|nr:hypothetical protein [Paludibacter sp.]
MKRTCLALKWNRVLFVFCAVGLMSFVTAQAQVRLNVNIGVQPSWGPASYDYAEYYFLPELGIYYSVPEHVFIYPHGNGWKFAKRLPGRYSHFDLYSTYKVVVNEPRPYLRHGYYVEHYRDYRNMRQDNRRDFRGDNGLHRGWEKNGKSREYDRDADRGYDHDNEPGHRGHGHGHDRD